MVRGIEQMRKEALLQFGQIEGAWKGREWHGQETQRVDEFEGSALEGQVFGPHRQLVCHLALLLVQLVQNKHAIEPFQIVKDHENLPLVIPASTSVRSSKSCKNCRAQSSPSNISRLEIIARNWANFQFGLA